MDFSQTIFLQTYSKIEKNVLNKKWKCVHKNCVNISINSHLLQKNGILNNITENGHIVQFGLNNVYNYSEGKFSFKKTGINKAISLPLFCNEHDTLIFKPIEIDVIDFNNYYVQMLFSYRSICAEIRRKEITFEVENQSLHSEILSTMIDKEMVKSFLSNVKLGIQDLTFFKKAIEKELNGNKQKDFSFHVFKYNCLDVCTSTVFSPVPDGILNSFISQFSKKPWRQVFVNLVPQTDFLYVIIGFHNDFNSKWITKFISKWNTNDLEQQQLNISNLMATRVKDWALSISLYNLIPEPKKQFFINYFSLNSRDFSEHLNFEDNLFCSS